VVDAYTHPTGKLACSPSAISASLPVPPNALYNGPPDRHLFVDAPPVGGPVIRSLDQHRPGDTIGSGLDEGKRSGRACTGKRARNSV